MNRKLILLAFNVTALTRRRLLITSVIVALWTVFCFPAIFFGKIFPLDIPRIITAGQDLQGSLPWIVSPYNGSGRYFPFYWLYNVLQSYWFNTYLPPFYFIQSIVFVAAASITTKITYGLTKSFKASLIVLVLLFFSTPLAENINTLGKAEPLAYFLVILSVYLFSKTLLVENKPTVQRLIVALLIAACFTLSIWTKETSIALFGFCFSGIFLSVAVKKIKKNLENKILRDYTWLLGVLLVGFTVSKLPYFFFPATKVEATYTDYTVTIKLFYENLSFYVTQQPDVAIFGMLAVILLAICGRKILSSGKEVSSEAISNYICATSLCAMGWGYYAVLLIWRWPMSYYMLLPALVFKIAAGYALCEIGRNGWMRLAMQRVIFTLILLCTIYASAYTYYISTSQISYSIMYAEALQRYAQILQEGSASIRSRPLVMESYPFYSEQVGGTSEALLLTAGFKVPTTGIADLLDPVVTGNAAILKLLNVTRDDLNSNMENLPKKGDYILAITGSKLATWFLRGVTPYYSADSILHSQEVYDMSLMAENEIRIRAPYVHVWYHNLEFGRTSIGYKLYRVNSDEPRFIWRERYPDGWMGKTASLQLTPSFRGPLILNLSAPDFALPNRITIRKNGKLIEDVYFSDTNEKTLILDLNPAGTDKYDFSVQTVVVTKKLKLNDDMRELGLRIALGNSR